ncbi:tetratricopeptide repeat protein [Denitrobaculum tricleocarpae]|uniref:tetratricopeptide repeat protein n=1 Tax=Denitrobaculum tricleocarpae TaxID=2591009 RepID=UPI0015D3DAC7|nr:tetratricopeptide repeat protein [Denitrobaculum tricleocarpae]
MLAQSTSETPTSETPTSERSASQASVEDGLAAYKAGRNAEAEKIWTPLAEAGDAVAQYSLGKLYETGANGAPDFEAAARWYALAAQQDMAAAQNNLGLMYAQGRGVPRDPTRASQLWSRSANASNPMAQYNLGLAYFRGDGVGQDQVEAAVWFHLAADAGVGEAQFALGQMHRLGLALPQDDRRALSWYQRAAKKGHKDAQVQAKRLEDQGIVAANAPDPVAEAARQKPQSASGQASSQASNQTQSAAQAAQEDRGTSLVTKGTAPSQARAAAGGSSESGGQGFQLESRLIRPEAGTGARPAASASGTAPVVPPAPPPAGSQVATLPEKPVSKTPAPKTPAAETAVPGTTAAQTANTQGSGTFLWLLSAPDEQQAMDLLREAETDYAAVLDGQDLTLMPGGQSAEPAFYRLVVAASSSAEATEICARIREINADAFCATLVR